MGRRIVQRQTDSATTPGSGDGARGSRGSAAMLSVQRMAGNRAAAGLMRAPAGSSAGAAAPSRAGAKSKLLISVTGQQQGRFKGSGRDGTIEAFGYHMAVVAPHDVATGAASGKRQYKAITFKKPLDASSPQFFNAVDRNEVLPTVTIRFVGTDPDGKEADVETVVLTNATVASFDQDDDNGSDIETVSLTFEQIELSNLAGKTSGKDSWSQ
jgi:type VI secretion system secreted protein Hcp